MGSILSTRTIDSDPKSHFRIYFLRPCPTLISLSQIPQETDSMQEMKTTFGEFFKNHTSIQKQVTGLVKGEVEQWYNQNKDLSQSNGEFWNICGFSELS